MVELECLPYGLGDSDEGVCLLVRLGPYQILLDCGLSDLSSLLKSPALTQGRTEGTCPLDLVLCSHAHPDHARGLLALHQTFPQLPIYGSEVTAQLLPLNWTEAESDSLFCQALPWRSPVEFREGLSAELWPAGHLPGAACLLLTYTPPSRRGEAPRSYTIFYTGDFFLSNSRLVEGLPLEELRGLKPDVLIVEGSYGTARHPRRRQQENQLAERISRAIAEKQSVLLPTPALGLGQELLMLLRSHHHFTGRDLDIWVDGAVAIGCDAYLELMPHLPSSVQNFAQHQSLFWDERVRPRVRRLVTPEQHRGLGQSPCIVLTDDVALLEEYIRPGSGSWLLLLPEQMGRQSQTALRQLSRLASTLANREARGIAPARVTRETYFLSEHGDGPSTTQLIHNLRPQHVILIHGSPAYLADLAGLEELNSRYHLHTPAAGTRVELPIGETFIQPAAPETSYEGELTELDRVITITLPNAITADPRWQNFADTGLLEARWQGNELVLRGLPQWELLSQGSDRLYPADPGPIRDACENCQHYRNQRCWGQSSPLFGFKVTPEGYCPAYEPKARADERT